MLLNKFITNDYLLISLINRLYLRGYFIDEIDLFCWGVYSNVGVK